MSSKSFPAFIRPEAIRVPIVEGTAEAIDLPDKYSSLPISCSSGSKAAAIKAFQEFNFKIPSDISFVGFDDLPVSSFINPPLSTLSVPKHEIGRQSVKMLLRQTPDKYTDQKCLLGGELIKRDSVLQVSG